MPSIIKAKKHKLNISDVISDLIREISDNFESFSHIDSSKVLVCIGSNRTNGRCGIYGKLVPLKFKNGSDVLKYKGKYYAMPRIMDNGIQLLYIMYFYTPKFFNLSAFEKIKIIFHELYHINPDFNGDIRRMGKVKLAHGSSRKRFDSNFEKDTKIFFDRLSNTDYMDFLNKDSKSLKKEYNVYGRRMKIPKPAIIQK